MDAKRKKVESLIYSIFDTLDKSGRNTKFYKDMFGKMSDPQFHNFMKKFLKDDTENFYLEIEPFNEPSLDDIEKAAKILNVPLEEYVYLPFESENKDNPIRTVQKVPVGYLHIKRLQQILSKKNSGSVNISQRSMKTGQVTGDDKNAQLSDVENYALNVLGADYALQEFLGPRADDMVMKDKMVKDIHKQGYATLKDLPSDIKNKQAVNTLDVYFTSAGIMTDLITPGLAFRYTLDNKKNSQSVHEKYEK